MQLARDYLIEVKKLVAYILKKEPIIGKSTQQAVLDAQAWLDNGSGLDGIKKEFIY